MNSTFTLPSRRLQLDRVLMMGILNVTPDSFYDHGRYRSHSDALQRAVQMAEEGADIIDVGGEKAGPGEYVSAESEIDRVIPVIEAIKRELDLPISVDTFKPQVARAAVEAGADIINSIGGFKEPEMRQVAVETGAAIVIMHIQGTPRVANPTPQYQNVVEEVSEFLQARAQLCVDEGVARDRIMIDPGPGFGKSTEHDVQVIARIDTLTTGVYPVLLAASRKKFIGDLLDVGVDERLEGSLAVAAWGALHGVKCIRTHDVRATKRVCLMIEAVQRCEIRA